VAGFLRHFAFALGHRHQSELHRAAFYRVLDAGLWRCTARSRADRRRVALGFLGVVAVLRPSINESQWLAALLGLGSGALSAIAMMQIRQLGRIGEPRMAHGLIFSVAVCDQRGGPEH
jgi:hypothetical protein